MAKSETCSRCGEEVRYGIRAGVATWLHRGDVDHHAVLGRVLTPEEWAEVARQRNEVVRYYDDGTAYTTAEHDIGKDPDPERRRARLAALHGVEDVAAVVPEPEQYATDVDPSEFPPRSGIRQIINLIEKQGWDLRYCKRSRGPYVGSSGAVLSTSEMVVIKGRQPAGLDGAPRWAVGSWRDGKFDSGYIGSIEGRQLAPRKVDATTMKNWIKGTE